MFFIDNFLRRQNGIKIALVILVLITIVVCFGCERNTNINTPKKLTVVSYGGGAYQESHKTAFCEPFGLFTAVKVESVTWNAEYGKLKAMVESGNVPWDVVEITAAQFKRGLNENLFEKLTVKPKKEDFLAGSVFDQGVANVYWGTVMAYRKDAFPDNPPKTWADFFDTNKFSGSRALYDDPRGTLEFALLADGVSKDKLYPLDVERAFRKLDEIKKHVRVWWTDGTQPVQLLLTKGVTLSSAWNGRIFASKDAREQIGYSWNGGALELDFWIVPKGSMNADLSSRFITFASTPEAMARQTEMVGYGPVNKVSFKYVREDVREHLPTFGPNWDVSFVIDAAWWAENEETIKTRWLSWKAR